MGPWQKWQGHARPVICYGQEREIIITLPPPPARPGFCMLGKLGEHFSPTSSFRASSFRRRGPGSGVAAVGETLSGYVVFFLGACGHPEPGVFGSESESLCNNQADQATFQSNPENFLLSSPPPTMEASLVLF